MRIKFVPQPYYCPDLIPLCLLVVLQAEGEPRGSRFEDIEKMKMVVKRVLDTFTLDKFNRAFTGWLDRYKNGIAIRGS